MKLSVLKPKSLQLWMFWTIMWGIVVSVIITTTLMVSRSHPKPGEDFGGFEQFDTLLFVEISKNEGSFKYLPVPTDFAINIAQKVDSKLWFFVISGQSDMFGNANLNIYPTYQRSFILMMIKQNQFRNAELCIQAWASIRFL